MEKLLPVLRRDTTFDGECIVPSRQDPCARSATMLIVSTLLDLKTVARKVCYLELEAKRTLLS
jgi:hypothetical protein